MNEHNDIAARALGIQVQQPPQTSLWKRLFGRRMTLEEKQLYHERLLGGNYPQAMFIPAVGSPGAGCRNDPKWHLQGRWSLDESGQWVAVRDFEVTLNEDGTKAKALPGGVVVLSVNVTHAGSSGLWGALRRFVDTWKNRLCKAAIATRAVTKAAGKGIGFSLGNLFRGRYVDSSGAVFDENSFAVEIVGITPEQLEEIAGALRDEFKQESVLVKDNATNEVYFYNRPSQDTPKQPPAQTELDLQEWTPATQG